MTLDEARRLAPPASQQMEWIIKGRGFSTLDIISVLMKADRESIIYDYSGLAKRFENPNSLVTLRNLYDFVKYQISYKGDESFKEICRLPQTLIATGVGDCKSFSLFIGSMLRSLKIKFIYRFAAYENKDFQHVYVVAYMEDREGIKAIVIDPVPGGSFITETKYSKFLDKMPEGVAIMRGAENSETDFLNYDEWSRGEMSLQLNKQYAKMLLQYHPDSPKVNEWRRGIEWIDNVLFSGIHGRNPKIQGSGYFRDIIEYAQKFPHPACGDVLTLGNRKSIGDPLIPIEDMSKCNVYNSSQGFWDVQTNRWVNGGGGNAGLYDECQRKLIETNAMKTVLNEKLEKFAARYVYHFCEGQELLDNSGYSFECKTKITDHRRLFDDLVSVTKLSADNMSLWSELGIGRQTALRGQGVRRASDVIQGLKDNPELGFYDENGAAIGIVLTTALCYCIIIAVSGSVAAGFVQACHNKEPTALGYAEKIIGRGWGAQGKDFAKPSGNTGNGGTTPTLPPTLPSQPSFWEQNKGKILIGGGITAVAVTTALITHEK
jgi:hypothetical protein